jgi:hypothetical protein
LFRPPFADCKTTWSPEEVIFSVLFDNKSQRNVVVELAKYCTEINY